MVQIYGTLGPACSDTKTLEALLQAGMTGVRLNLSHAGLDRAAEQIEHLHAAARRIEMHTEGPGIWREN